MFKQLLASAMTLGLLSATPAMALEAGHRTLLDTLKEKGVYVEVNPQGVCDAVKTESSYHGVYLYSDKYESPMMAICQDFGGIGDETIWTENDLDTLRHESLHFLQDCLGDGVDGEMLPIYDGPGGASYVELSSKDIIGALGYDNAMGIINRYEANGASQDVIILELEAFYLASTQDAGTIAKVIDKVCPAQ